jgi:hypothetical protein
VLWCAVRCCAVQAEAANPACQLVLVEDPAEVLDELEGRADPHQVQTYHAGPCCTSSAHAVTWPVSKLCNMACLRSVQCVFGSRLTKMQIAGHMHFV